jgi:hypothetical protein
MIVMQEMALYNDYRRNKEKVQEKIGGIEEGKSTNYLY